MGRQLEIMVSVVTFDVFLVQFVEWQNIAQTLFNKLSKAYSLYRDDFNILLPVLYHMHIIKLLTDPVNLLNSMTFASLLRYYNKIFYVIK